MLLNNKELNYSFSQFRLYNECPKKYKLKYFYSFQEPTNDNLILGSLIHKLFEIANTSNEEYDKLLYELHEHTGYFYTNKLSEEIKTFVNNLNILEKELKLYLNDFIGIIDLVYKVADNSYNYVIADYKVTKKPKTKSSIYSESQLLIYKYIYCKINNIDPKSVAVQYINVSPNLKEKLIEPIEVYNPDISECESAFEATLDVQKKILNGEFPKKKTWCKWCFYKDICDNVE